METVEQALAWARAALAGVSDSEPLDAPVLLAYVLDTDRAALIAHPDRALTPDHAARFRDLVTRRAAGTPVPYLTGTRAFYGLELFVTPDVLIPRPETEHLIDAALAWAGGRSGLRVADVGTGSGAIAVALATHLPDAQVWALDMSPAALAVASRNVDRYDLGKRVRCTGGDLLEPCVGSLQMDLIAANLPYIAQADLEGLPVVQYEPRLALAGGADGLDLIRRLLVQAPAVLAAGGLLLMEIGAGQGARVRALAEAAFPGARAWLIADYGGHDRVVCVEREN